MLTARLRFIFCLLIAFGGCHADLSASVHIIVADTITIRGTVTDASGEPLPFANIQVQGTGVGTQSDLSGRFQIRAARGAVLICSFTGYERQEIIAQLPEHDFVLQASTANLQEVVVQGYGSARKIDLTGSSVQVKGSDIAQNPLMTATQALQGRAAGVQIVNSGAPGSAPNVRIRGAGSILGDADPLYIVDGIITTDIRNINTADILSIDVLKDASSTAIYGARAANGVVIINTKAGGDQKMGVQYETQVQMRRIAHAIEMAPPGYYADYSNEAAEFPIVTVGQVTGKTNWYDAITRNAISQRHNLSFNGTKGKYKYYLSAGFLDEQGIMVDNRYKRYTMRYNHEWAVTKSIKIGNTLSASQYRSFNKPYSAFTQAYIAAPIFNATNPDGTFGNISSLINNVGNPLATIKSTNDQSFGHRLQGYLYGEYSFLKHWSFRSQLGIDRERNNGFAFTPEYYTYLPDGLAGAQRNELADLRFERDTIYQWVWDNFVNYETRFGTDHHLKITGGHTAERRDGWRSKAEINNNNALINDPATWQLMFTDTALGQQNLRDPISNYFRRESYFSRINYVLKDRYLFNATARADANSNFPKSNRWGFFPSIGLGWVVSNEPWMKASDLFSQLKVRGSFGITGNDVIRPGQFDLRPTERLYAYFGTDRIDGAIVTGIIDPNLKWENVYEYDLGIEYGLFGGAVRGEIDWYHKTARDALYTISYPALGFGTEFLTNAADVLNTGLEFSARWIKTINARTEQSIGFNVSANKNRVLNVGLGRALNFGNLGNGFTATQAVQGQPIGSFWVFRTDGIFQNDQEVAAYPHVVGTKPGDLKIIDKNNDGAITNLDREHVGSAQPKVFGGINYGLTMGKWDFGLDLYGSFGSKVYNAKKGLRFGSNYNVELDVAKNRWRPGSGENQNPRASNVTPFPTDYFVESGSFIRINAVTVGRKMTLGIGERSSTLRVFASAQNPYLFSKYTGFTPELPGRPVEAGIELNVYPISSAYVIGALFNY
jgi:TonB-dependent starch-binding outer membrane protein SusC